MGANKAGERVVEKWLYDALARDSVSIIASRPQMALPRLGEETEANRGVPDDPHCRRGRRESGANCGHWPPLQGPEGGAHCSQRSAAGSPPGLLSPPRRSSPILCVCACLSTPAHSSFYKGQPPSVHRGRTLRGGRAPGAAVQGEGGQQPSPPATAEKAQEGHRGPGFLGAPSKTQPFSWEAGIGAGQTWAECPPPWVGGHRGPSEVSNPMSTIKREPGRPKEDRAL